MTNDRQTENVASEGTGASPCWPLPAEWQGLIPPQPTEIVGATDNNYKTTYTKPVWNRKWLRGLETYVRSIVRDEITKANATGESRAI